MSRAGWKANDRLLRFSQVATIAVVADYFSTSLPRFFAASLALHIVAFLLIASPRMIFTSVPQDPIKVSLLPEQPLPEEPKSAEAPAAPPKPAPPARQSRLRHASKAPAMVAKKTSPPTAQKRSVENVKPYPQNPPDELPQSEVRRENPRPREPTPEETVIVERPLPTVRELLPSVTYSLHDTGAENNSVSLYTTDPKYVTYVGKIKQSIEMEWQYPEIALRYGLQGKLALEFIVAGNGQLQGLRLIRSSGSSLLDEEALRAIKAAAPFPPIPPWIKPNPLRISATMEYRDSRLDYRFTR